MYRQKVTLSCIVSNEPESDVPCGDCTACCQLLAPYLTPEEVSSGKYPISFVQGPEGPVITIYKNPETGGCGMLIDNRCSIYEDRPHACRVYDCRKGHHPKTNIVAREKFGIDIE